MITQQIKVYGRVQGVGFRNATTTLAKKFDVTGTVQNVDDYVEVYVSGERNEVQRFSEKVIKGPAPFSRVKSYEVQEVPYQDYNQFKQI